MELEKGDSVFLHCCTVQHVLLQTPVSWIVMLFMQYWETSKYPNMLWRYVICPLIGLSAKERTDSFHCVYGLSTVLFIHLLTYCFLCNVWHDTKPNKNAKIWNCIQGQDRLGFVGRMCSSETCASHLFLALWTMSLSLNSYLPFCVQYS